MSINVVWAILFVEKWGRTFLNEFKIDSHAVGSEGWFQTALKLILWDTLSLDLLNYFSILFSYSVLRFWRLFSNLECYWNPNWSNNYLSTALTEANPDSVGVHQNLELKRRIHFGALTIWRHLNNYIKIWWRFFSFLIHHEKRDHYVWRN